MSKKYIKNCTGEVGGERKILGKIGCGHPSFSRIVFYFLLVAFVGVLIFILFFSQYLQISNIEISGTVELDGSEIKQSTEKMFDGKYVGFVPKNNYLFVSQNRVEKALKDDFKKIRTVSIAKKFPDSVVITVDERKALLVWCGADKCYLIDENGVAYNEADFNSQESLQNNLIKIDDNSGKEIALGETVIDSSYEKFVLDLKDSIKKLGFEADGEYFTPSRMAEEIRVKTIQGPELYFSTQFPLKTALNALGVVLKKEIPEDKRADLEYIDLRNEGKVFFKSKTQVESENAQAENSETKDSEKK